MTQYSSPMARQFNGPVIDALLKARFQIFAASEEYINHRAELSIDNATTEELDKIGEFMLIPRPYKNVEGVNIEATDQMYRLFLKNTASLRKSKSILALNDWLSQFITNGLFFIQFQTNGDLKIIVHNEYDDYLPFLEQVVRSVYTALPRLAPIESLDFSVFVINHVFYAHLATIWDSDFGFAYSPHTGYISILDNTKYSVSNHVFHMTTGGNNG